MHIADYFYFSSDSDFVDSHPKVPSKHVNKSFNPNSKRSRAPQTTENRSLLNRVSPHCLYGAISVMNGPQRECVMKMGFGALL